MIRSFVLNNTLVKSSEPNGKVLADLIRKDFRKKGTTIACREGDCGACTVLVGELKGDRIFYRSLTSCVSPWVNANGKHIVTIEGLTLDKSGANSGNGILNLIQSAFKKQAATQCGYCTPGFIVSVAGYFLRAETINFEDAWSSVDGNICRCTGYKSIERAVRDLVQDYQNKVNQGAHSLEALVSLGVVPEYFLSIPEKLKSLKATGQSVPSEASSESLRVMGGGTDLLVQKPHVIYSEDLLLMQESISETIEIKDHRVFLGGACRIEDFRLSEAMNSMIPNLKAMFKLFASTQIRHQGTIAGNIVNGSPIGDVTNFLLALSATLHLDLGGAKRSVPLSDFFTGYKTNLLKPGEVIKYISFPVPDKNSYINLEKVSKRTYLDIASVTTSAHIIYNGALIQHTVFSAGGVGPVPMVLNSLTKELSQKSLTVDRVRYGVSMALKEVAPLSDVRGSESYKLLALRQLLFAHFIEMFPEKFNIKELAS